MGKREFSQGGSIETARFQGAKRLVGKRKTQSGSSFDGARNKIIIISAWRYPGTSPVGKKIPIPDNIWEELVRENLVS